MFLPASHLRHLYDLYISKEGYKGICNVDFTVQDTSNEELKREYDLDEYGCLIIQSFDKDLKINDILLSIDDVNIYNDGNYHLRRFRYICTFLL